MKIFANVVAISTYEWEWKNRTLTTGNTKGRLGRLAGRQYLHGKERG